MKTIKYSDEELMVIKLRGHNVLSSAVYKREMIMESFMMYTCTSPCYYVYNGHIITFEVDDSINELYIMEQRLKEKKEKTKFKIQVET